MTKARPRGLLTGQNLYHAYHIVRDLENREQQQRAEERHIRSEERAEEAHALQIDRMHEELRNQKIAQQLAEARFKDPKTSGLLGRSRFATLHDARRIGLCDSSGLFLGLLDGTGIYYNGERPLVTYAGTRSGKGRNLVLQALGRYEQRTVIVTDVKDGENAFSSAHHRLHNLKQRVITLNPKGLYGLPKTRLNPLDLVIQAPDNEKFDKAEFITSVLFPQINPDALNAWVNEGAALIVRCVITHLARIAPQECTLGRLWEFFTTDTDTLVKNLKQLETSPSRTVAGYSKLIQGWTKAITQWAAYTSAFGRAFQGFAPESVYTQATDASDFDVRDLTKERHTVYLMMPHDDIKEKGMWVSLMLNHLIRVTAANPGPVQTLFLLDEFTQLPPVPVVTDAINMTAGRGQQFWIFAQDRESLERDYGKARARQFERMSGITQLWQSRDRELIQDVEYLAGKTSVNMIGANMSHGGHVGTGLQLTEQARPLIQAEDHRLAAEDEQFIIPFQGPVIKARLWPWDKTEGIRQVLRDPRQALFVKTLEPLQPLLEHEAEPSDEDLQTQESI